MGIRRISPMRLREGGVAMKAYVGDGGISAVINF